MVARPLIGQTYNTSPKGFKGGSKWRVVALCIRYKTLSHRCAGGAEEEYVSEISLQIVICKDYSFY